MNKILLVVSVVSVAFGYHRIDHIKRALNYVVHFGDMDFILLHIKNPAVYEGTNFVYVFISKLN